MLKKKYRADITLLLLPATLLLIMGITGCTHIAAVSERAATEIKVATEIATDNHSNVADNPPQNPLDLLATLPLACTASVFRPARFIEQQRKIRVFEPSPAFNNVPAEIAWETKRIQTEPARFAVETTPARYREVTEVVEVLRERTELIGVPAQYKIYERPVLVQPAHQRWKANCLPSAGAIDRCLEQVPAQKIVVKQQLVDVPARTVQKRLPAKSVAIKRKILLTPGTGNGQVLPARYQEVAIGRVNKVWEIESVRQAERFETVTVKKQVEPALRRVFPVLCTDNKAGAESTNRKAVRMIQQMLSQQNYNTAMTGRFDQQTLAAMIRFQQKNQLFTGAMTRETLRKLMSAWQ